jgi:uncharacterized protein (DUF983 family)
MPFEITDSHMSEGPREAWPSIRRGFMCRCPQCGVGPMFGRFLKVQPVCEHCGEELFHEQAHDFPPYITITIVAHVILFGIVMVEQHGEWSMEMQMAVWLPLTLILTFALMQPVKGAVVGYQWARRMHGFDGGDDLAEIKARSEKLKDSAA